MVNYILMNKKEVIKMDIFEKTRELGEMIKDSNEMKVLKDCEEKQNNDAKAQELLSEFNLKKMNLVRDMQEGKITREVAIEENNKQFETISGHETIAAYIEAKKAFDEMVGEVNNILNYYITGQEPGGCTHDCGSCGGCH